MSERAPDIRVEADGRAESRTVLVTPRPGLPRAVAQLDSHDESGLLGTRKLPPSESMVPPALNFTPSRCRRVKPQAE
jgi:hypothetical protein